MPFKSKERHAAYMRKRREQRKQLREKARNLSKKKQQQLKQGFPSIYAYVFGLDVKAKRRDKKRALGDVIL